jgi:hypothetical protein
MTDRQGATCKFSKLPPKECVLSSGHPAGLEIGQQPVKITMGGTEHATLYEFLVDDSVNPRVYGLQTLTEGSDELGDKFACQIRDVVTTFGDSIEAACKSYFATFHYWLPLLSEFDFWYQFHTTSNHWDPEFEVLIIGILLLVYAPTTDEDEEDFLESTYSTAKSAWVYLQRNREPSFILIEAGLLLATYEYGQALGKQKEASLNACVRLSRSMGLDMTIRRKDVPNAIDKRVLGRSRWLWWAVIIHER